MHVLFFLSTDSKNYRVEGGCTSMRKTFEIPPNNGKNCVFLRALLQDAESDVIYGHRISTPNEIT